MNSGAQEYPATERRSPKPARLWAPDVLRGLIMIFMALDHANHFIAHKHSTGEYWGGPFPVYEDPLAFLTRFVTHFCAPGFFFLMGVGMMLFARSRGERGWRRWDVIKHFWLRGLVLIVLKLTVVDRAWELTPSGWSGLSLYLGVLFALGGGMILAAPLLWLKPGALLAVAAALLIGTELVVPDPSQWGPMSALTHILLLPGGPAHSGGGTTFWWLRSTIGRRSCPD